MKHHRLSKQGFAHYVLPLLVIAVIAIAGSAYLVASHADNLTTPIQTTSTIQPTTTSPSTTTVTDYNYQQVLSPPTTPINDTLSFSTQPVKVIQITGSQSVNFTEVYPGTTSSKPALISSNSCYTIRAVSQAATVKIVGYNGVSKTVAVKPYPKNDGYNHWQYTCVSAPAAASATGPTYFIQHLSGGAVNVYDLEAVSTYAY